METFTFDTRLGRVVITAVLNNGIWDNVQFQMPAGFSSLPDSQYLEELITYAVLEGPIPVAGDTYDFTLDKEEGWPASWTWSDNTCGSALDAFTFTAV